MKFIVGEKTGMTQVFTEDGTCRAATVLKVAPATIAQVKTTERDGYEAVQVAFGEQKAHHAKKAQQGHFQRAVAGAREFRPRGDASAALADVAPGASLDVSSFAVGDAITVSATSKGKGFQGVVKRHGFSGSNSTHGTKHSEREPGSIGQTGINRVLKGMRMAGRMGGETVTVKGLKVLQVNPEENVLVVSGAVPGRKGTLVEVYGS